MIVLRYRHCRDRLRRIRLGAPVQSLEKVFTAMDNEFPVLEYVHIAPFAKHITHLILPSTFEYHNHITSCSITSPLR